MQDLSFMYPDIRVMVSEVPVPAAFIVDWLVKNHHVDEQWAVAALWDVISDDNLVYTASGHVRI